MSQRINLKLDQFFKRECANFFPPFGYEVQSEYELSTVTKRIDVVVLRKSHIPPLAKLELFHYFSDHNLLSYKSFQDHFQLRDIHDCMIYYYYYLQLNPEACRDNLTVTLLLSKRPRKFLSEYGGAVEEIEQGVYVIENPIIHMRVINIEVVDLSSADSMFLTAFCKDLARLKETQRQFCKAGFYYKQKSAC